MLQAVIYLCLALYIVRGDANNNCAWDFKYADNINKTINITETCNDASPCIVKCCPVNQTLVYNGEPSCLENTYISSVYNITQDDYSDIDIYENNVKQNIRKSNKKMEQFITLYSDDFLLNYVCAMDTEDMYSKPVRDVYILENGGLLLRHPNYFKLWPLDIPQSEFCVDHQINLDAEGKASKPELVFRMQVESGDAFQEYFNKNTLTASLMLISCVFLLLVLAVYALLSELRNLAGWMLMACVSTLIANFLLRAVQVLVTNDTNLPKATCIWLGLTAHYAMIASFTWMNVMSFDIWWSLRGFRKMRQIHRRGILVKFGWYSLYGWGAPALLTIFIIVVENLDLRDSMPTFIKYNYLPLDMCFIQDQEQLIYLDCPIAIAISINIVLFLMTAYNIRRIKHGVSQHSAGDSRRNKKAETRFGIYLKLSVVMGISWVLEVVSAFYESESLWWYGPDAFNSLVGVLIFFIFICKRSILVPLCKRLRIENKYIQKWKADDSNNTDSVRLNNKRSQRSRRKILDTVTESSDVDEQCRKYYFEHSDLKLNEKPV